MIAAGSMGIAGVDTVFLDDGGVLVQPGWARVSATLARHGVSVRAEALRAADPLARRDIDESLVVGRTTDQSRGWQYFNRVLGHAGVPLSGATDAALGLFDWFDHVLDSHEWGVEKPDPRLFRHALEVAGASAVRTIHVGDLYHVDVVGARRAGLRDAVLIDAAGLYPAADCPRVSRLEEVAVVLGSG
jgi:hypothetical protein